METHDLSFADLKGALHGASKLIVCGYGLSEEDHIPQFDGILKGVWSGPPRNIDPFNSEFGREMVMGWFGWRMHLIRRRNHDQHFSCCSGLAANLGTVTVATQTVDGQLSQSGMEGTLELFGNIFRGRCIGCKSVYPGLSEEDLEPGNQPICDNCGSTFFPDVTMFAWNQQDTAMARFATHYHTANTIISIGTDTELTPEIDPQAFVRGTRRLIVIAPDRITLYGQGNARYAAIPELAKMLEESYGIHLPTPGNPGFRRSTEFLAHCARAIG